MIQSFLKKALDRVFDLNDLSSEGLAEIDQDILQGVEAYTMTSPERVMAVLDAIRYVVKNRVSGSIVECGVWRGGTMMAVAKMFMHLGEPQRDLYLFDTFAGMPAPTEFDRDFRGRSAKKSFDRRRFSNDSSNWCYAALPDVKSNLESVGYPPEKIHYIVGKVEQTLPGTKTGDIAILRLDTDWYESTRHEMVHLFPRLVKGGVLIIDDYGHWKGARKAVDEYFEEQKIPILLNRIDYTGRIAVKI